MRPPRLVLQGRELNFTFKPETLIAKIISALFITGVN